MIENISDSERKEAIENANTDEKNKNNFAIN